MLNCAKSSKLFIELVSLFIADQLKPKFFCIVGYNHGFIGIIGVTVLNAISCIVYVALQQQVEMYGNTVMADVYFTLKEGGQSKRIAAHKVILAAASPVFKAMFYGGLPEKGDVEIIDATPSEFEIFLQAIYGMYKNISIGNISDTMRLADKYGCNGVMHVCTSYLNEDINKDNVCFAVSLIKYYTPGVIDKCADVMLENADYVLQSEGFADVDRETLDRILQVVVPHANGKVFAEGCMKWAEKACEKELIEATPVNLRATLGLCFLYIVFEEMRMHEFLEFERLYPIFDFNEYRNIVTAISRRQ